MTEHSENSTQTNQPETQPKKDTKTLAEQLAREISEKFGYKIEKLPKDWCRVFFKK